MRRRRSPDRLIVIASVPRSGSSLLARALHAAGIARTRPSAEALNQSTFAANLIGLSRIRYRMGRPFSATEKASARSRRAALRKISRHSTNEDGTLVIKVHWSQLEFFLLRHGLDLDAFGAPITWVRIRRIDRVQQAVSLARAQQTKSWNSSQQELRLPEYNATHITEQLGVIRHEDESWDAYLSALGADPLEITYEELDADYEGTVRRVLDHIGASDAVVPPRQISRQADQINAEWVERYLSESDG